MKTINEFWLPLRAIRWLSRKLGVDYLLLQKIVEEIRKPTNSLYQTIIVRRNGKKRKLYVPNNDLKLIQQRINRRILAKLPKNTNVFGFSGGDIKSALTPHLKAEAIWTCDIKDAFPSMFRERVFGAFRYHFSEGASQVLTLLTTTLSGTLPQGAPTSPRIFDLCLRLFDREFSKIAESKDGCYTRYADNLFFSGKKESFAEIEKEVFDWFHMADLIIHKVRVKDLNEQTAVRALGLNIIEQKIHNTRDFKKALRLSIHHVGWLLDHRKKRTVRFKKAWQKLQGQINFACTDTLPKGILKDYSELGKRLG